MGLHWGRSVGERDPIWRLLGTLAGSNNSGVIGPTAFYSPTNNVIAATSRSFTCGTVRVAIYYMLCNVPTS